MNSCCRTLTRTEKNLTYDIRRRTHVGQRVSDINRRWNHLWKKPSLDGERQQKRDQSRVTSAPGSWLRLMIASLATSVAFGPLRANVLHVYPLFKVLGLLRLLDTHRRGIHPLDEPLAIGVRQLTMPQHSAHVFPSWSERDLLPNERQRTRARLKAACKKEGLPRFPLWAPLLKSPTSNVTPSWTHRLRSNNKKLTQTEQRAAHLLLTWTLRIEKKWQPPSTGLLNRSFTTIPSRVPSALFFAGTMIEFVVTSRSNVSLLSRSAQWWTVTTWNLWWRVEWLAKPTPSWRQMICQDSQMWLATALWSSARGRHGFHTKTWMWYELITPRLSPLSGSCTSSFELAGARGNVKFGSRSASDVRCVVSTISLSKSEWYLHSSW